MSSRNACCTCGAGRASGESVSAIWQRLHRASRSLRTTPASCCKPPRTPQSPVPTQPCGDQERLASQGLGKRRRQRQARPLAPRRGPKARTLLDRGGSTPKEREGRKRAETEKTREHTHKPGTQGYPLSGKGRGAHIVRDAWATAGAHQLGARVSKTAAAFTKPGRQRRAPSSWFSLVDT